MDEDRVQQQRNITNTRGVEEPRHGTPLESVPTRRLSIQMNELEEWICGQPTERNVAGRQRVRNGALVIESARDAPAELGPSDDLDFVIIDDVIDPAECSAYCEAFRSISPVNRRSASGNGFWDGRIVYIEELIFSYLPLALRAKKVCQYSVELISRFYGLQEPIYAATAALACWREGTYMNPHTDNAAAKGAPPNIAWRRFSTFICLNDDYEGGEIYICPLNKIVTPKRGRLVAFTSGFHHEHALLKIKKGTRYVMPMFFTNDEGRANEFVYS
jgi:hypothetical protein